MQYLVEVSEKIKPKAYRVVEVKHFYIIDEFKCWWKAKYANKDFIYRLYKFESCGDWVGDD